VTHTQTARGTVAGNDAEVASVPGLVPKNDLI